MKIVVISDSHGNIANLKQVLGFAQKIKAEAVIHCGDWNNLAAVEIVLASKIPLFAVLGNADIAVELKNKFRDFLQVKIDGRTILIVHSTKKIKTKLENLDIIFCGHLHRQAEFEQDGVKIINPGALEREINFAIYDTQINQVEFIHD